MTTFVQSKLGAGGWVTGIDHTSDGTKLARTDTNGVYLWNTSTLRWDNIVNQTSLTGSGVSLGLGAWDAVIAPSNTNIFYLAYDGYMFKTTNRGATWSKQITFTRDANAPGYANGGNRRLSGQKIAVDPTNSDHVYAGQTDAGLWRTIDGGTTWAQVSTASVPVGTGADFQTNPGIAGICFDPNGGSSNGRLNIVYVGSYNNGVYKTTNAGTAGTVTWTQISSGASNPLCVYHAQMDLTLGGTYGGSYYCAESSDSNGGEVFTGWRYHGTTWTQIGSDISHIVVHPTTSGRVAMFQHFNANAGFVSTTGGASPTAIQSGIGGTNVATDIPWLAYTYDGFKSLGDARFDLSTSGSNEICIGEGIGWWHTVYPTTNVAFNWNSQSLGLDQLVPNVVLGLSNGDMLFGVSDRAVFRNLNTASFPTQNYPNDLSTTSLLDCRSLVRCAGTPGFAAGIMNTSFSEGSSYTTDGGTSWSYFPLCPSGSGGATIAPPANGAAVDRYGGTLAINSNDSTNLLWMPGNNGPGIFKTTNRGTSWSNVTPATSPPLTGSNTGWGGVFGFTPTSRVIADEVTADVFYAYWDGDDLTVGTANELFFKSTDKGANWTNVHGQINVGGATLVDAKYYVKFRAVPANAGYLFICAGGGLSGLFKSVDGGTTWTQPNANVSAVTDYCFGYSGTVTPIMYMIGTLSGTVGIYQSVDLGVNWSTIAAATAVLPDLSNQSLWAIGASQTISGLFYIGLASGGGFVQTDVSGVATPAFGFSVITDSGQRRTRMIGY